MIYNLKRYSFILGLYFCGYYGLRYLNKFKLFRKFSTIEICFIRMFFILYFINYFEQINNKKFDVQSLQLLFIRLID